MPSGHSGWSDDRDRFTPDAYLSVDDQITVDDNLLPADLDDAAADGDEPPVGGRPEEICRESSGNTARRGGFIAQRVAVPAKESERSAACAVTIDE